MPTDPALLDAFGHGAACALLGLALLTLGAWCCAAACWCGAGRTGGSHIAAAQERARIVGLLVRRRDALRLQGLDEDLRGLELHGRLSLAGADALAEALAVLRAER